MALREVEACFKFPPMATENRIIYSCPKKTIWTSKSHGGEIPQSRSIKVNQNEGRKTINEIKVGVWDNQ